MGHGDHRRRSVSEDGLEVGVHRLRAGGGSFWPLTPKFQCDKPLTEGVWGGSLGRATAAQGKARRPSLTVTRVGVTRAARLSESWNWMVGHWQGMALGW